MKLRAENLPLELRQTATKSARPRIEWRRWLVALIAVGTAFVARWFASPILGNELPFFGFIAASLVAAWYGGAVVGVSALLIGLVLGEFFFTGPDLGFAVADHVELVRVLRYVGTAALGVFLIEVLHRGRLRVHQALQQREAEIRRREKFETRLGEAQAQPGAYARELEQRVTERTASLQQSVNSLENVLYHVAHDLRAPVRALSGFTNLLLTEHGPKLNADGVDYCRRIVRATERMDALTSDLLAYGHVAAAELRIVEVDLNKVVADALQRVATSIRASNARISVASDLGRVRADSRVVGESLVELLTNALKFVAPGVQPQIQIFSETLDDKLRLCVRDNGIGVDASFHRRIFGLFNRLVTTDEPLATGVGLALVAKGMERIGGEAGVQSLPGHGSCFWLEFPKGLSSA